VRLGQHFLKHEVVVYDRHAPYDRLDRSSLSASAREVLRRNILRRCCRYCAKESECRYHRSVHGFPPLPWRHASNDAPAYLRLESRLWRQKSSWTEGQWSRQRMSALGHKQTYAPHNGMSALPPTATAKADMPKWSCLLYP